jgi:UDP-N-acetylmuramyl pentapeptide phosphotransferase/UDP-N-acetylglucosamine-1-phosphate transferase
VTALFATTCLGAALLAAVAIVLLRPLLQRYALARPNARSSHRIPTPQGGGIAVLAAALAVGAVAAMLGLPPLDAGTVAALFAVALSAVVLAGLGAFDDIRPLPVLPRLGVQFAAVALVVVAATNVQRLGPDWLPLGVEQAVLVLAGVWFVNLVNFMDGLDLMTVVEFSPLCAVLAAFSLAGVLPPAEGVLAAALLGGLLGFAPFNRPVARLFLGDVGSLPIGLIAGYLLLVLASRGGLAAAILLPLYYLADATLTLLRRLVRGERVWQAHRSHFYQRATDNGYSVPSVVGQVLVLNLYLAVLAAFSLGASAPALQAAIVGLGAAGVGFVLLRFSRPRAGMATA